MTKRDETPVQNKGLIVSRVVEALRAGRGATNDELADAVGLKRSTYFNRIKDGKWSFDEVTKLAEYFDEPITSFIDGMGGRFAPLVPGIPHPRRRSTDIGPDTGESSVRYTDLPRARRALCATAA